ncbi:MAG: 2Fe-2S iron-sulfur cluster binding domain-containing protein [Deltaproteobacteria bacterium]
MNALLVPGLSMAALAAVLAVIILIAERYLLDYGEVDLTINDEKKFRVKGGNTVLSTLKDQHIFIPSACGGRATCAYCKVKAVSGFGDILPTETPLLTEEEIVDGIRLSCQIKIKNDVAIEIPEELFYIKEFRARAAKIIDLTYDIKWFHLELIEPDTIEFKAGQYIQFQTPEYGNQSESVYRAYSMCNVPSAKNRIELMVRLVPEGICTTYLFEYMKESDEVTFTGPFGEFYLRDSGRPMICVAGGTGMAPIRSILRTMPREEIEKRRPVFFFGARSRRDLFMLDEWREFERENPGFTFIPALSRPDQEDEWEGETGRITEVLTRHVDEDSDAEAYLCGSPGMLDACLSVLTQKGLPEDRIYYDKFE